MDEIKTRAERMYEAVNDALDQAPLDVGPFVIGECTISDDRKTVTVLTMVGDHQEPYVITNPPLLVPDPNGDVDVRGKKYREDPLAALSVIFSRMEDGRVVTP